jgi:hypothetical protein
MSGSVAKARRRGSSATGGLDADVAALAQLPYPALQAEWRRLYRAHPPKKISRDLLEVAVAWKLQEKAVGGLSRTAKRQLESLAAALGAGGEIATPRAVAIKSGAKLVREWNGETHEVRALADGFQWRGRRWTSLSAIAREITGTRWSGPRFFGLRPGGNNPTAGSVSPAPREPGEAARE